MPFLVRRSLPARPRSVLTMRVRAEARRVLAFGLDHPWRCLVAAVTGLALGVAVGLPLACGLVSPLVLILLGAAAMSVVEGRRVGRHEPVCIDVLLPLSNLK